MPQSSPSSARRWPERASVLIAGPAVRDLAAGMSQGAGVKRLLERLDIPPESVLACGDAENDVEMLCMVGVGGHGQCSRPPSRQRTTLSPRMTRTVAESVRRFVFGERDSE